MLHQLLDAGYQPGISFDAGNLTGMKMELDGVIYLIQSQQLIKSEIDGQVAVSDEATYNNMNVALDTVKRQIFKNVYKSHYSDFDLELLDEYRSKAVVGNLRDTKAKDLVEIDISKAETSSLCSLKEIPVFNEFDAFTPYEPNDPIHPLN